MARMTPTSSVDERSLLRALCVSDIPFAGPIGAVRVGRIERPVRGQSRRTPRREESAISISIYVGNKTDVIMIEGAAEETSARKTSVKALHFAQEPRHEAGARCRKSWLPSAGKAETRSPSWPRGESKSCLTLPTPVAGDRIEAAIYTPWQSRARGKAVDALRDEVSEAILAEVPRRRWGFRDQSGL